MLLTEKEKRLYETALKKLEKCDGDCKHCAKCHVYVSEKILCYAFGCDLLPKEHFDSISESMANLRKDAIEQLKFELS